MLTPFLKYVSEGKVIRKFSDLERFTFPEVTERIYLSFLALALMSQQKETESFVKAYADQTMHCYHRWHTLLFSEHGHSGDVA